MTPCGCPDRHHLYETNKAPFTSLVWQTNPKLWGQLSTRCQFWANWSFKFSSVYEREKSWKSFLYGDIKGHELLSGHFLFWRQRQIWPASFTFSSPSRWWLFLAAESGCFQNKFLTEYIKRSQCHSGGLALCACFHFTVCVCVCCYVRACATTGHEDRGQMDSMFAGKHAGGTGKLCCLWRTRETNQIWIIFLLFQLLSFAAFSSLASSVTTQWAGLCVCVCVEGRGEFTGPRRHTCSELTCTQEETQCSHCSHWVFLSLLD